MVWLCSPLVSLPTWVANAPMAAPMMTRASTATVYAQQLKFSCAAKSGIPSYRLLVSPWRRGNAARYAGVLEERSRGMNTSASSRSASGSSSVRVIVDPEISGFQTYLPRIS
jgi:hypothetical protein